MASLDILDYLAQLDDELAKPGADGRPLLAPALRKSGLRDVRRALDAMAFRFAILDERPLPEDLDYLRAVEALHAPARVADVVARRRPFYAAARRRRLVTTWSILVIFVLLAGGLAYLATSERSTTYVDETFRDDEKRTFVVTDEVTRLRIEGQFIFPRGSPGAIEVLLISPDNKTALYKSYSPNDNIYLRQNIDDPMPGEWRLEVEFLDTPGTALVSVRGVSPTR